MTKWRSIVLLGVLAAAAFLPLLGRRDIVTSHEARVAQTARLMAESGWPWACRPVEVLPAHLMHRGPIVRLEPDTAAPRIQVNPWLVPVLTDEIRLQKPPLPYWCAAALFRWIGVGEIGARIVPALLGALCTLLLYDLTSHLFGRRSAWCTALVWLSTAFMPEAFRKAMADPYLAFFTLTCVWAWISASLPLQQGSLIAEAGRPGLPTKEEGPRRKKLILIYLLAFYLSLAFGLLAKGPPLIIVLLIPLAAYHICFRRPLPRLWLGHLLGIAVTLIVALPWPLYVLNHVPHAMDLWRYESVGELSDNTENARPWWFYGPNLPMLALPWAAAWVAGLAYPFVRKRRRREAAFPLAWYAVSVVFFSFVHLKKNQYLLPALPAQAMLIGQALAAVLAWARRTRGAGVPGLIMAVQALLGVGFALAMPVLLVQATGNWAVAATLGLLGVLAALYPVRLMLSGRRKAWVIAQAVAYLVLLLLFNEGYFTSEENHRSFRPLAPEVTAAALEPHRTIFVQKLPEEAAWYLPITLQYDGDKPSVLVVVDDVAEVRRRQRLRPSPAPPVPDAAAFAHWFPDAQVTSIERLEFPHSQGDSRWKVYELQIDRRRYATR